MLRADEGVVQAIVKYYYDGSRTSLRVNGMQGDEFVVNVGVHVVKKTFFKTSIQSKLTTLKEEQRV